MEGMEEKGRAMSSMSWGRFAAMIATSTVVMFFLMYQLIHSLDDALFSTTRLVASLVMGCVMAIVMLAFMWSMYRGQGVKLAVLVGATLLGSGLVAVDRSQVLIDDVAFMQAIPHHSIAVNNARKATITDPRVRSLSDQIIESQVREIAEMNLLIDDIREHGERGETALPPRTAELTPAMRSRAREAVK